MKSSPSSCRSWMLLAAIATGPVIAAQVPVPPVPARPPGPDPMSQDPQGRRAQDPPRGLWLERPFNPADTGIAPFQGFPAFPSALSGYGGYPAPPRALVEPPTGILTVPPPLLPAPPDWPSWVSVKGRPDLPYAPDQAVLVRASDRVWFRTPEEEAFVPLYFHDKMRGLGAGSEIEVRQSGEFHLLFHGGTRLYSFGPGRVSLPAMTADTLAIEVGAFTHLRVICRGRAHAIALPDGSVLRVEPEAEDGPVDLHLERDGERASVFNSGRRGCVLHTAFGDRALLPGHRVFVLLAKPRAPMGAALAHPGTGKEAQGDAIVFRGGEGAEVSWLGARFQLPSGVTLRLEPIQGRPFAEPAEPGPEGR